MINFTLNTSSFKPREALALASIPLYELVGQRQCVPRFGV